MEAAPSIKGIISWSDPGIAVKKGIFFSVFFRKNSACLLIRNRNLKSLKSFILSLSLSLYLSLRRAVSAF